MGFNFVWIEPRWSFPIAIPSAVVLVTEGKISLHLCTQDHHFHKDAASALALLLSCILHFVVVEVFFLLLAWRTFACGDFVWMVVHPRLKLGLKSPGRRGKSDTKPTTTNSDLFVLLVVAVFNMAQY